MTLEEKRKQYYKEWYTKNREQLLIKKKNYQKKYREQNKDKIAQYGAEYYHKNKEVICEKVKKYCSDHKHELAEYRKKWNKENPEKKAKSRRAYKKKFKIAENLKSRILKAIKQQSGKKAFKSLELIGCSVEFLRSYIESKFLDGMSWENHGKFGWHLDHIRPCASFDLTDPNQQKACFHFSNIQPLWWRDNLSKGDSWTPSTIAQG